jgi:hypothetical protein
MPRLQELYKLIRRFSKRERTILYFAFFRAAVSPEQFPHLSVYSKIKLAEQRLREKEQG